MSLTEIRKTGKKYKAFKRLMLIVLATTLLFILIACGLQSDRHAAGVSADQLGKGLEVHFLDVGQADCILVESAGQYMLIDAGNNEDEQFIIDYLKNTGVVEIDYVIGTHPHADHIGSLDAVIREFDVKTVIMPDKIHTTKTFEDVLDAAEEKNLEITLPEAGDRYTLGEAVFTITAPVRDYDDNLNNWSVGLLLENENHRFYFSGDAEEDAEADVVHSGISIKADVYKVNHHGSNTSSSELLLDDIECTYAVIMCGVDNSYGHPHEEVLKKLQQRDIEVYRTDLQGTIIAISDNNELKWSVEKGSTLSGANLADAEESETENTGGQTEMYIGNRNSKKYHRDTCNSLPAEKNQIIFNSKNEAQKQEYEPCGNCNP